MYIRYYALFSHLLGSAIEAYKSRWACLLERCRFRLASLMVSNSEFSRVHRLEQAEDTDDSENPCGSNRIRWRDVRRTLPVVNPRAIIIRLISIVIARISSVTATKSNHTCCIVRVCQHRIINQRISKNLIYSSF